ncbi:MAG: ROK family transcriptional regulator [Spirochaetaceae bacterium]|jgi:predicted NBD/HSP70 family sugar kinase|nr:ROK family transcriptional regulator [Spirochaetaceae bacterium]
MGPKKLSNLSIQKNNRTNIYRLLREGTALSKQEIVQRLRLSLPTVTNNLTELQDEGLVSEGGFIGNTGGRRAKTYTTVNDARLAVGLDITKDYVIAVIVDLRGEIICKTKALLKFEQTGAYYEQLATVVQDVVHSGVSDKRRILGVGIGVPGLVTEDHLKVFYGEILKFTGATCEEFSRHIPFKTALLNDASAAGFGEFWIRGRQGSAFYISLSNNIGGTVMIDSRIHNGAHYHSGEIGHLTLYPHGKRCYCGQLGCVESYLASTILSSECNGNLSGFFKRLAQHDTRAVSLWEVYLNDLARTVNNLQQLFDCTIILGGYVAEYIDAYLDELKLRAGKLNPFEKDNADYIEICRYKTWSIAAGAALHFVSEFINGV